MKTVDFFLFCLYAALAERKRNLAFPGQVGPELSYFLLAVPIILFRRILFCTNFLFSVFSHFSDFPTAQFISERHSGCKLQGKIPTMPLNCMQKNRWKKGICKRKLQWQKFAFHMTTRCDTSKNLQFNSYILHPIYSRLYCLSDLFSFIKKILKGITVNSKVWLEKKY